MAQEEVPAINEEHIAHTGTHVCDRELMSARAPPKFSQPASRRSKQVSIFNTTGPAGDFRDPTRLAFFSFFWLVLPARPSQASSEDRRAEESKHPQF